ncbi:MAG: hypothetical protein KME35_00505 [Aphanocapsa sp. GSE-SYN-MK-11-07L]|nr:hypothetical protein [Aphanocapsa sp. GSE-SYN-MK-11-07L]
MNIDHFSSKQQYIRMMVKVLQEQTDRLHDDLKSLKLRLEIAKVMNSLPEIDDLDAATIRTGIQIFGLLDACRHQEVLMHLVRHENESQDDPLHPDLSQMQQEQLKIQVARLEELYFKSSDLI